MAKWAAYLDLAIVGTVDQIDMQAGKVVPFAAAVTAMNWASIRRVGPPARRAPRHSRRADCPRRREARVLYEQSVPQSPEMVEAGP
jgi:hypothetical protein